MIHIVPSANKRKQFMVSKTGTVELSNGHKMYIHAGYLTDFASVPFWLPFQRIGSYKTAFLIHDYIYNYRGYYTDKKLTHFEPVSRLFADKEMKWQMRKYGSSKFRAFIYYVGVRLGGLFRYGKI